MTGTSCAGQLKETMMSRIIISFVISFLALIPYSFAGEAPSLVDFFEPTHTFELSDEHEDALIGQIDQAILVDDSIWVLDARVAKTILRFDLEGNFLGVVGAQGKGPGEYLYPIDLKFDGENYIYLRTRFRNQLLVYDKQGNHVKDVTTEPFWGIPYPLFGHFVIYDDRIIGPTDREGSLSQLVFYDFNGKPKSPQFKAPKDKQHDKFAFESKITKVGPFVAYPASTFTGAFLFNPQTGENHKLEVHGFPDLIDPSEFNFDRSTYKGDPFLQLFKHSKKAWKLFNIGDRYIALGSFSSLPLKELRAYFKKGNFPEEKDFTNYYQLFNLKGERVISRVRVHPKGEGRNLIPLSGTGDYAIFVQTWQDSEPLEGNPIIHLMKPKADLKIN
jgi:hypothetical protein